MSQSYWSGILRKRIGRRHALAATGVTAASAALLAACGGSSDDGGSSSPGRRASELVVPIQDETKSVKRGGIYKSVLSTPPTLDPHFTGSQVTHVWMSYSQLLKVKPGHMQQTDGDVEGEILDSWEVSPDKLTITGRLTQNARFTPNAPVNGRAVDLQDVLFSWQRYNAVSPRRAELSNQHNPGAPILSLAAADDRTLVIKLKQPIVTILSSLTGGVPGTFYIVPREAENTSVLDLKGTLAGSGPWYLSEWVPSSRTIFRRNPGFKQDKRGELPYMDGVDFIDLAEYATILAQFKAGAIHDTFNNFLPDDILPTKRDVEALEIMSAGTIAGANIRAFFGHEPASPFRDERVRQAWAMTWDRDLFIDVSFNVEKFRKEGLPVETSYDNGLRGQSFAGWWLDPRSKEFGPNAKYFKHDLAEAKKLLAAAGHNNGVDYDVYFGTLASHTASYGKHLEILVGMARDSGMWRPKMNELNFNTEWNPSFRNNKGRFVGQGFIFDTGEADPANDLHSHYHTTGSRVFGGDATMDDMLDKMLQEFDTKKRQAIAHDVQRYEGGKMYQPRPGGATNFRISWPALRHKNLWQGDNQGRYLATLWLDQERPPFKR